MPAANPDDEQIFNDFAEKAVKEVVDDMPLLKLPREERRVIYTHGEPLDFYGARDGKLHANGMEFHIKGINWYGTEGKQLMLEGLHVRPLGELLDFLVEHQFNAMRLLFNMQDWRDDAAIPQDHFNPELNPELVGLKYRAMLMHITQAAAQRGILVMLACHRLRRFYSDGIHAEWPSGWDGWWHDAKVGLDVHTVEHLWTDIAQTFCGEWNVFAADIFNEPSQARWNTRQLNDWGFAAGLYGNSVLDGCPRLLVFVQGAGRQNGNAPSDTCWGGSFTDAKAIMHPSPVPHLRNQSKLVLSPHAYGPSLYKLPATRRFMPHHFKFPIDAYANVLPAKWDQIWGFIPDTGLRPPLVLSETGGDMSCCDLRELDSPGADAAWQVQLIEYLHRKSAGLFYFCLNPYSDDTGGIIQKDFRTPVAHKIKMLSVARSTKSIEGHAEQSPWYDLDPLLRRTLLGASVAGLLVGVCLARSRLFGYRPTAARPRRTTEPARKAITHKGAGTRTGGVLTAAARGLLVPYPSDRKKKRGGDAKKGKRRGGAAEEVEALAPCGADDAETFEDGLLALHGEPSPSHEAAASAFTTAAAAAVELPVVDEAQQQQLDAEFEAIIRKHSTIRAAALRGGP